MSKKNLFIFAIFATIAFSFNLICSNNKDIHDFNNFNRQVFPHMQKAAITRGFIKGALSGLLLSSPCFQLGKETREKILIPLAATIVGGFVGAISGLATLLHNKEVMYNYHLSADKDEEERLINYFLVRFQISTLLTGALVGLGATGFVYYSHNK